MSTDIISDDGILRGLNLSNRPTPTLTPALLPVAPVISKTISEAESMNALASAKTLVGIESQQEAQSQEAQSYQAQSQETQSYQAQSQETQSSFQSQSFQTKTTKTSRRTRTMTMSLAESCRSFKLEGATLICECLLANGSYKESWINLNQYIGVVNGNLVWHQRGFFENCTDIHLEGTILYARCKKTGSDEWIDCSIDLALKLRNNDGILVMIAYDEKLSVMLSEVPWMKFKVIAEPDFSLFTNHPVMQSTLVQIATTTVEHVTAKFEALMSIALAETIQIVTQSAMEHVEQSLVVLTQNLTAGSHAHLHETYTGCGQLKSQHYEACACKPFQCSCPPYSLDILANGKAFQGIQNGADFSASANGKVFQSIQNAAEFGATATGKAFQSIQNAAEFGTGATGKAFQTMQNVADLGANYLAAR